MKHDDLPQDTANLYEKINIYKKKKAIEIKRNHCK